MNNALGRVPPQHAALCGIRKDGSQADSLHTLAPAPMPRTIAWDTSAPPWVHPPAQLCCPAMAPELGPLSAPFQDGYKTMLKLFLISSPRQTLLPCKESVLSLAFLLPAGLTLSCSWASSPSMANHSSVTNYHNWAVIIGISPSCLSLLKVFTPTWKFWGRLSWALELPRATRRRLIQRHVMVLAQSPRFSGELSPHWLSKSNAFHSSGVRFFLKSATAFLTTPYLFNLWDQSLESYGYRSTNICQFLKKNSHVFPSVNFPAVSTLLSFIWCFVFTFLTSCSLQHLPVIPHPSFFSSMLRYYVLFVYFFFTILLGV